MEVHQIITGALNKGANVFAVGSIHGINFTACAVGCDIVILSSDFHRVQVISGSKSGYVQVSCVDCCNETGKIAAAFYDLIRIYKPFPISKVSKVHKLNYQWVAVSYFSVKSAASNISLNLEGLRLLVSSETELQMFQHRSLTEYCSTTEDGKGGDAGDSSEREVRFHVSPSIGSYATDEAVADKMCLWDCIWSTTLSSPLRIMRFSPDGAFFATNGKDDNLVKIWYQEFNREADSQQKISYDFVYLDHPKAVIGVEWRRPGRHMPRGFFVNALITWCEDHVCRIWRETVASIESDFLNSFRSSEKLTDASYVDVESHKRSQLKTARLKIRNRLRNLIAKKKSKSSKADTTIGLITSSSSLDALITTAKNLPSVHFHIAASISADTENLLTPTVGRSIVESTLIIHWLNNKELEFSLGAEKILAEALKSDSENGVNGDGRSPLMNGPQEFVDSLKDGSVPSDAQHADLNSLGSLRDHLDVKIELLLREWQQSSDVLFAVHPSDGSLLMWSVDFLDSGSRMAQTCLTSRLPGVFPVTDAASMCSNLAVLNPRDPLYVEILQKDIYSAFDVEDSMQIHDVSYNLSSCIFLLTTHKNGTLNLWHINVDGKSKFCQMLSATHKSRMCGHRFIVNSVACSPVLPLFLTTSHHNVGNKKYSLAASAETPTDSAQHDIQRFSSELILWKVNPVGPLQKEGGVEELARINSLELSAFSRVAWVPAVLPSFSLGNCSNSPSSCFVASDGHILRAFQAVLDARTLLAAAKLSVVKCIDSPDSNCSGDSSTLEESMLFQPNIVSSQSTAQPGCIIELDAISDSSLNWANVQLMHVFHEQLLHGDCDASDLAEEREKLFAECGVDFESAEFYNNFFLVVLESKEQDDHTFTSFLHMWLLALVCWSRDDASHSKQSTADPTYPCPPTALSGPTLDLSLFLSMDPRRDWRWIVLNQVKVQAEASAEPKTDDIVVSQNTRLRVCSKKMCCQRLKLPDGVKITDCRPCMSHLSSSSVYPACRAPYLLVTSCSDDRLRFWKCLVNHGRLLNERYTWDEWRMISGRQESNIEMDGPILGVSCAYGGRLACCYDCDDTRTNDGVCDVINVDVSVYECESTGGIDWVLEDVIHLKNILIHRITYLPEHLEDFSPYEEDPGEMLLNSVNNNHDRKMVRFRSSRNVLTKQCLIGKGREDISWKDVVQLDWVSVEDGSHILTVGVGPLICIFCPIAEDTAQHNISIMKERDQMKLKRRKLVRKSSTISQMPLKKLVRWICLRTVQLESADGLPPLPRTLSWVRHGIMVVCIDSEMRVYSQWNITGSKESINEASAVKTMAVASADTTIEYATPQKAKDSMRRITSVPILHVSPSVSALDLLRKASNKDAAPGSGAKKKMPSATATKKLDLKEMFGKEVAEQFGESVLNVIANQGLFEATRSALPLLPQYHPRLLIELLKAGKARRAKAIVLHLLNSIRQYSAASRAVGRRRSSSGPQDDAGRPAPYAVMPSEINPLVEETEAEYVDIDAISPLPLYVLFSADIDPFSMSSPSKSKDSSTEDLLSRLSDNVGAAKIRDTYDGLTFKANQENCTEMETSADGFSPSHARLLTSILTHVHLPGLSSLDQLHLLAVADTLSYFSTESVEKLSFLHTGFSNPSATQSIGPDSRGYAAGSTTESVDDCGLKFLITLRLYEYLLRCLPANQRMSLKSKGLSTASIIWALHSESQAELLNSLPCMQRNAPNWPDLRAYGVGWWLSNIVTLRNCIEKVAKASFQEKNDPMDSALFYIAMKKKNVLMYLFRAAKDTKMSDFFSRDFTEEKWRKAAMKNAFVLMSKQRFQHAMAFFLLADSLQDAVKVCINNMGDLQLALVILRLYESDADRLHWQVRVLLGTQVFGQRLDDDGKTLADAVEPVSDPFLRSIAYWHLKEYELACKTFLDELDMFAKGDLMSTEYSISDVFNFYVYIRSHPLVIRKILDDRQVVIKSTEQFIAISQFLTDRTTFVERKLYFKTAATHFKCGCPLLALEVLSRLPMVIAPTSVSEELAPIEAILTGQKPKGDGSAGPSLTETGISFSVSNARVKGSLGAGPGLVDSLESDHGCTKLDIILQQAKFIACMKILIEELTTLATGYDVEGGQLRSHLYYWLEKEIDVMKRICSFKVDVTPSSTSDEECEVLNTVASGETVDSRALHQLLRADRTRMVGRWKLVLRRRKWLNAHQQILRTLTYFCSLHSSQIAGLASSRMELLLLLEELCRNPSLTRTQLVTPLPALDSFPLLSASVASVNSEASISFWYLHSQISDLLKTFGEMNRPPRFEDSWSKMYMLYNLSQCLSACLYISLCDTGSVSFPTDLMSDNSHPLLYVERHPSPAPLEPQVTSTPEKWPGVDNLVRLLSLGQQEDLPNLLMLLVEGWVAIYLSLFAYAFTSYDSRWLYRLMAHPVNDELFSAVFGGGSERKTLLEYVAGCPTSASSDSNDLLSVTQSGDSSNSYRSTVSLENSDRVKLRAKFHSKVFGLQPDNTWQAGSVAPGYSKTAPVPTSLAPKVSSRTEWLPPRKSVVGYYMMKPVISEEDENLFGYDSDFDVSLAGSDEESGGYESDDDANERETKREVKIREQQSYVDPNSYAWRILRLALVRQALYRVKQFIGICGLEYAEIGSQSPLIRCCILTLEDWMYSIMAELDRFPGGCPANFLPNTGPSPNNGDGPSLCKYRCILEPGNTPFDPSDRNALPVRRLWLYLVRQEHLMDVFIRYIFKPKKAKREQEEPETSSMSMLSKEPRKIIQREQDPINCFAVNQSRYGWIVVSSSRELQEMDISPVLSPVADWMDDPFELDLNAAELKKDPLVDNDNYLLVSPDEKKDGTMIAARGSVYLTPFIVDRSRYALRKAIGVKSVSKLQRYFGAMLPSVIVTPSLCRRQISGVRRLEAHPHLSYYLSGSNDGSIRMWEWGVSQPLFTLKMGSRLPKVTRIHFNNQGNKFGVTDIDGSISLWQISYGMTMKNPYSYFRCHTKTAHDFAYVADTSTFLATAGQSSSDANVALWDLLLPPLNSLVKVWNCHPDGCYCMMYVPFQLSLFTGGKHGELCIWDLRQRQIRHTLKVFEHASVRCLSLDPSQEFFAAGSSDGDIKIFNLCPVPQLLYNFPGEHSSRGGFSFRQVGTGASQGVLALHVDQEQRMFSCGTDCSLKLRSLCLKRGRPDFF